MLIARPTQRAGPQGLGRGRGEVAEWSIAPHSKCGVRASVPGVRIPPSPPKPTPIHCDLYIPARCRGRFGPARSPVRPWASPAPWLDRVYSVGSRARSCGSAVPRDREPSYRREPPRLVRCPGQACNPWSRISVMRSTRQFAGNWTAGFGARVSKSSGRGDFPGPARAHPAGPCRRPAFRWAAGLSAPLRMPALVDPYRGTAEIFSLSISLMSFFKIFPVGPSGKLSKNSMRRGTLYEDSRSLQNDSSMSCVSSAPA